MRTLWVTIVLVAIVASAPAPSGSAAETWPEGLVRIRDLSGTPFPLVEQGQPAADFVVAPQSELVRNAADWISAFARERCGAELKIVSAAKSGTRRIVVAVGDDPALGELHSAGLQLDPRVGPEGYVLQRVTDSARGEVLVCWSPAELGCRYGLIEILRTLQVRGQTVTTNVVRVVDRPQFPVRICYVNFAEHLQNAFNPNVLFDVPVNRWSRADWERFIDMVSAFRYNVFEFWLVPTLFSPEALRGGKIQTEFAGTINHAIAYAKRRGVAVHPIQAVNTVGPQWHYHCPHVPAEHAEIVALWDHWSRAMKGNELIGFFPGDPGGCFQNGCTAETYVDLCLELAQVVRKNNPSVKIEVGTWGDPMAGWGVPLWTGKPERAQQAMKYFLEKLPQFPPDTFTSINLGFSPDCHPTSHGGDGRPHAREAAKTHTVLTWDYSVTEGEGTVSPRCRVRRMLDRRREELALGCYSGGICYTMAPQLQCLSIFCCAESWWNPSRTAEDVLADFGRFTFGEPLAAIGPLLEEFEVIPDWGYYPPFPYSPPRLQASMTKLRLLLEQVDPAASPRLPLAPTMAEYRQSLLFYADLFQKLAAVATAVDELNSAARASGRIAADRKEPVSLEEAEELLGAAADFPQKTRLTQRAAELRQLDVRALTDSYWKTVYGIYESIPHPVDPRAQGATGALFGRFNCQYALVVPPSPLEQPLKATGKPYLLVRLGRTGGERGWRLTGWTLRGEDQGEPWRASFDEPGLLARDDFQDQGYRWLVVRLTEGPQGGRKTIAVNGQVIGQFERTGPPVSVKKEWWVTRSYPVPAGLLKNGRLEIRFTDPGIAIAAVALAVERVPDTK